MLDPKTLFRAIILLCAVCVPPHFGASRTVVRADVGSEGTISTVDQSGTIKGLREENAKLKRALWDAKVENANLRTEIDVRKHREKRDRETNNRVLLVLTIAIALILLFRFTAPRLRDN